MGQRGTEMKLEGAIAKMVFFIIMLFVLIAFLQRLNLTIYRPDRFSATCQVWGLPVSRERVKGPM
jgi:hypothetical protein